MKRIAEIPLLLFAMALCTVLLFYLYTAYQTLTSVGIWSPAYPL
jgi:hypothetical protein